MQRGEFGVELADLFVESLMSAGQSAQRGLGRLHGVGQISSGTKPRAGVDECWGVRPRSCSRSSAGPLSSRARSWLIAWVRA